ncbi:Protein_phosphatase 2C [Hexamita inflata]|uniref:Protein phosphatase 2C n=1 Tax=Hexamita inflata TaxID=28002 RepID=A0AA86TNU2_9EUKA|nr:Protein phosphatase 2C [Hexamita inflata]CAI9940484.1 Protein phosphatase 2C [Hexamita inflata]
MSYQNYIKSPVVRQTATLPSLQRLNSADREHAIRQLQEEMAYNYYPTKNAQVDSQVESSVGVSSATIKADFTSIQGRRMSQEDSEIVFQNQNYQIFSVFDGHGGRECAAFCASAFVDTFLNEIINVPPKAALFNSFISCDNAFSRRGLDTVGCTATCLVHDLRSKKLFIANTGDSKTVVGFKKQTQPGGRQTPTLQNQIVFSTLDHKPSAPSEQARIKKSFPNTRIVTMMGIARVDGQLSLSRAIGDEYMKMSGIIPDPDLYEHPAENIEYVLLACDGLFDVFSVTEVDDMVRTMKAGKRTSLHSTKAQLLDAALAYFNGNQPEGDKLMGAIAGQRIYKTNACEDVSPTQNKSKKMSQVLTKLAFWKNSMDNITVIVGLVD